MKKIISLFQRNYAGDRIVRNEVTPGAEWVINGEGIATRKFDGTCCMIQNGVLYKRYDAKNCSVPPQGFIPAQEPDPITNHWPGWIKVGDGREDKLFIEGYNYLTRFRPGDDAFYGIDGTYELIGPKINGNKEQQKNHILIRHGLYIFKDAPRDYEGLKMWFTEINTACEGIVWYRTSGDMVKIKRKDFGLKW